MADGEKASVEDTTPREDSARIAAREGQVATDRYGHSIVSIDSSEEARLRLKIDLCTIPTVSFLYLFCFIDRTNIGNARLAGLEEDLGLSGNDYNTVLMIFYVSYIVFEIPSNALCKHIGPGWYIPFLSLLFGVCTIGTAFVEDMKDMIGVRFLLGLFEAGMLPGIAYYLSRWYRRSELAFRIALYIVMGPLAGAFGGLLASVILKLDNFHGLREWRMIFAIEGIVTCGLSLIAFVTLTDSPETARWLSPSEKELAVSRLKSERIAQTELLDSLDFQKWLKGMFSPVTLSTSLIFMLNNITSQGFAVFAPTIVRGVYPGLSTISQQLQTVPPYVVGAFFTLLVPFLSWRIDRRLIFMLFLIPVRVVGCVMFIVSPDPNIRYTATFLIAASTFQFSALTNAHVSANVVADSARSAAIGVNVMMGNVGGLFATWTFVPSDAPEYQAGMKINLGTSTAIFVIATSLLAWMRWDNRTRANQDVDKELEGLTDQQVRDLDWRHPAFRWHV